MPRQILRQRRFALRDPFDLTRPPADGATGSLGGLHAIEIQAEICWDCEKPQLQRKQEEQKSTFQFLFATQN